MASAGGASGAPDDSPAPGLRADDLMPGGGVMRSYSDDYAKQTGGIESEVTTRS